MPFLIPLIPALIAGATGVAGVVEGAQAGGRQQKALTQQEQIAQQEMADKQQAFKQLTDFFTPYLKEGSPFLKMIQQASAATTATGANNAAGAIRSTVGASGLGFGPSGTTGAAISELGAETTKTSSSNYLSNLLNNEAIKFQAAQGLKDAGAMAGASQNQPNVSADLNSLNAPSLGNGLSGLADILKGLIKPSSTTPNKPGPTVPSGPPGQPGATAFNPGTTQGWSV